ncbi:hypothetical protein CSB20_06795 [bacterium DOLZORAL124_64_63]|nr:MAG: hypothetical protein CSB20_06795 [bacterium DOLZORAL124_64_63]
MLLLLNSTKTMDLDAPVPPRLRTTEPRQLELARPLAAELAKMSRPQLIRLMGLSEKLADETRANAVLWGGRDRPTIPCLYGFTGLLYKSLDAPSLDAAQRRAIQKRLRILSGLYGVLRPLDRIEAYRLEMGDKLAVGGARNMVEYWRANLTAQLNADLKPGEPIISVAALEYTKALDLKSLKGPLIHPVFKERHADGTLKTVTVHSKKARGALVRFAITSGARAPRDLLAFDALGWEAAEEPPESGPWLFTRPVSV